MLGFTTLAAGIPPSQSRTGGNYMDCGSVKLCGLLALETGLGSGYYKHPSPGVHGLWPETGSFGSSACVAPSDPTDPTTLFSCYKDSSQPDSHQIEFETHEWDK